jgi:hypothetical protein
MAMNSPTRGAIQSIHALYCELTGQKLTLRFERERLWYEFLGAGFNAEDLKTVVNYLQREIRAGRRNPGALKISNLLQPDRFEEDLNIRKVRLRGPSCCGSSRRVPCEPPPPTPAQLQELRQQAKAAFARLRQQLGDAHNP